MKEIILIDASEVSKKPAGRELLDIIKDIPEFKFKDSRLKISTNVAIQINSPHIIIFNAFLQRMRLEGTISIIVDLDR